MDTTGNYYNRWMTNLPAWITAAPITCLSIPGTHNSGTSDLEPSLGVAVDQSKSIRRMGNTYCGQKVVYNWSKTQTLSITEQLEAGIRFFDFRVAVHPRTLEFRFVHGLYGGLVPLALRDINIFLNNNPYEIVILNFSHFYNMSDTAHNMLLTELRTVFGYRLVPPPFSTPNYRMWGTSLQALWQTPYRVIVLYHQLESLVSYPEIWSENYIEAPWANTSNINNLIAFLEEKYSNRRRYNNDTFYVWQGVATATTRDIALNLGSSLKSKLALRATLSFVNWLKNGKRPGPQGINICSADFVESHDFIPTVIQLNQYLQQLPTTF
ncbi:PI-PLC X domain-containing protein 2 [Mactra antiquata]